MWKAIEHENVKLKAQAVKCIVNFCNGIKDSNESLLEEYAGTLLSKLAKLFEQSLTSTYIPIQAEVLCCMSLIATAMKEKFAAYYSTFIPGLKTLLANTPMETLKQKQLRANTIHTIGNMIYALSEMEKDKEVIVNDAKEITVMLIALLKTNLTDDDPQTVAIYNFWSQSTYVLKESFAEYLPSVVPSLFNFMNASLELKVADTQNPVSQFDEKDVMINFGKVKLGVNSQVFRDKVLAANILMEICANMKKAFKPYTEEMAKSVCENFKVLTSKSLLQATAKSFKCLLETCDTKEEMVKLFNFIYPAMKATILKNAEDELLSHLKFLLKELCNAMRFFIDGPQMLSEGEMIALCDILGKSLQAYHKLHQDKIDHLHTSKQLEEDEIERVNEEIDKAAKVLTHSMEIAGIIAKLYTTQAFAPFAAKLIPEFVYFWQNTGGSTRVHLGAICFFCDVIEYFNSATYHSEVAAQSAQKFLNAMNDEERDIVQSASYGLGLIAQHAQGVFKEILAPTLQALLKVVQEPDSRSEEKGTCTECAIGAIGKIGLFFYGHELVGAPSIQQYLGWLPLKAESEEAQNVHKLLFEQILAKNPAVMGSVDHVKGALERIHALATAEPDLEILRPEDVPLLQQCVAVLTGA